MAVDVKPNAFPSFVSLRYSFSDCTPYRFSTASVIPYPAQYSSSFSVNGCCTVRYGRGLCSGSAARSSVPVGSSVPSPFIPFSSATGTTRMAACRSRTVSGGTSSLIPKHSSRSIVSSISTKSAAFLQSSPLIFATIKKQSPEKSPFPKSFILYVPLRRS